MHGAMIEGLNKLAEKDVETPVAFLVSKAADRKAARCLKSSDVQMDTLDLQVRLLVRKALEANDKYAYATNQATKCADWLPWWTWIAQSNIYAHGHEHSGGSSIGCTTGLARWYADLRDAAGQGHG